MTKMFAAVGWLALLFLGTAAAAAESADLTEREEALRECGNMHDLEVLRFANSSGAYINGECALSCIIDGRLFPPVTINEGAVCPLNIRGHCLRGHCMLPPRREPHNDPMRECANLNHVQWHLFNSSQTAYEEGQCRVLCYIKGELASEHDLNGGYPCSTSKGKGTCSSGQCLISGGHSVTPTLATTITTSTPEIEVPVYEDINVTSVSATFLTGTLKAANGQPPHLLTNSSLCVKNKQIRVFEQFECIRYCASLLSPCTIKFNSQPHYFLFNVWSHNQPATTSLGDVFKDTQELFDDMIASPKGFKLKKPDPKTAGEISARNVPFLLYNNSTLTVGEITLDLQLEYQNKKKPVV